MDTLIIVVAHFPAILPAGDSVHLLQKLYFVNFVADTFCIKLIHRIHTNQCYSPFRIIAIEGCWDGVVGWSVVVGERQKIIGGGWRENIENIRKATLNMLLPHWLDYYSIRCHAKQKCWKDLLSISWNQVALAAKNAVYQNWSNKSYISYIMNVPSDSIVQFRKWKLTHIYITCILQEENKLGNI